MPRGRSGGLRKHRRIHHLLIQSYNSLQNYWGNSISPGDVPVDPTVLTLFRLPSQERKIASCHKLLHSWVTISRVFTVKGSWIWNKGICSWSQCGWRVSTSALFPMLVKGDLFLKCSSGICFWNHTGTHFSTHFPDSVQSHPSWCLSLKSCRTWPSSNSLVHSLHLKERLVQPPPAGAALGEHLIWSLTLCGTCPAHGSLTVRVFSISPLLCFAPFPRLGVFAVLSASTRIPHDC